MVEETKVDVKPERKTEVDLFNMLEAPQKVLSEQHGRVVKEFNEHCRKSMRVVPIVTALSNVENYKLLKEIKETLNLLLQAITVVNEDDKKSGVRKPIK